MQPGDVPDRGEAIGWSTPPTWPLAAELADAPEPGAMAGASARNRLTGLVTRVVRDGVMAQVDLQAGPFRVVSLMSREAADELGARARRGRRGHGEGHQRGGRDPRENR